MTRPFHTDGSCDRPVQWNFDNLLPEEFLREVLAMEEKFDRSDAFGLLRYFGSVFAGSLVLREHGATVVEQGLKPLTLDDLQLRIKQLRTSPMESELHKKPLQNRITNTSKQL
ncbi:HipA N-terminal domain-containing protein [Rhodoferax sp.]|uniref:HipA N-terminal domain-containing protein n=1 Tax=Rhodoferax sp. TaxID=50421 RepID=UPI00261F66B1|nr:HipA N-terminal domain-containing protein [Rhodoferax sp.]MDD2919683.1 HipA N-terminal domain-containing protein [Rhodoferax sp.]